MAAIFISHSSEDAAPAARIAEALQARGFQHLFLDFDAVHGIAGGSQWERELYRQLRQCQAVVVLCSPHSMESDWVFAEITHARAQGKPVIPLEIAPCTPRSILSDTQIIRSESLKAEGLQRLWVALEKAGLDPAKLERWQGTRAPYPGLAAFDEADAAVFFGRDADVREGLDVLTQLRRFGGARVALFLGPSGSGKSSLVRAGILPKLRRNPDWLLVPPMRPGRRPLETLASVLSRCYEELGSDRQADVIVDELSDPGEPGPLGAVAEDLLDHADRPASSLVLVVDQLEELLDPDQARQSEALLDLLLPELTRPDSRLLLIATMRSDFLGELQRHPRLRGIPYRDVPVRGLDRSDFAQVIAEPARVAGVELESGLVDRILQDTATEQALPLLAYALRALWEQYGQDGRLTIAEYRDGLGGLDGSIRRAADSLLDSYDPSPRALAALRDAFRRLVRINEEGQYARRSAHWEDLPTASHDILHRFVDHRLLVSGEAEHTLEVAHEALFRVWPRLRAWLDEDREFLLWRRRLQGSVEEWRHSQAPLRDAPLTEAERWLRDHPEDLTDEERALIEHSAALRTADADRERRRRRTTVGGLITGLASVTLLLGITVYQFQLVKHSEAETREQLARTHWVTGVRSRDDQDDRITAGHHFARSAELISGRPSGQSALMAVEFISHTIRLERIIQPEGSLGGMAATDDFGLIATWGGDDRITLWSTGPDTTRRLPHANVIGAAFFADGQLASWSSDGKVWIWDVEQGKRLRELPHAEDLRGAQVGTSSDRILTWDTTGAVRLWNRNDAEPLTHYEHEARVNRAHLGEDGSVLSWSNDRTVRFHTASGTDIWRHPDVVMRAERDPDTGDVLSVAADGRVRLWRSGAREPVHTFATESGLPMDGARFVGSRPRVLTWDLEGTLRVWDRDTGAVVAAFGHGSAIRWVAHHPESGIIASCGQDGRVVLWSAEGVRLRVLWHKGPVRGAGFSRDGTRLVTWNEDHRARLWDTRNGQLQGFPMVHEDSVKAARFDADETHIVTWSAAGSVRLWRAQTANAGGTRLTHVEPIVDIAGPAEGEHLYALTSTGAVRRWPLDVSRDPETVTLQGQTGVSVQGGRVLPEHDRVLGWGQGGIGLWQLPQGSPVQGEALGAGSIGLGDVVTTPGGLHLLAWGDDGYALVVDGLSGAVRARLPHGQPVIHGALSDDGDWALTAGARFQIHNWQIDKPEPVATLAVTGVLALGIRPDNRLAFAAAADGWIELWDPQTGERMTPIRHGASVIGAAFSPDGSALVSWDRDGSIRLWDPSDAHEKVPTFQHGPGLTRVAFSPDGRRLISRSERGARVWSAEDGYALTPRLLHEEAIRGAKLLPGRPLAVVWGSRIARLWPLPRDDLAESEMVALRQEVLSGTRLGPGGEVQVLTLEEWRARKQRIAGGS